MKFFADTASLKEIEYCFSRGVNDGITTNPKILETTGDLSLGFESACKAILQKYPNVPISLETDLRGIDLSNTENNIRKVRDVILKQAREISSWQDNVVVKIPFCLGGLLATEILFEEGIKTNVTATMTPYQALEAANAGATFVNIFVNRVLDCYVLESAGYKLEDVLKTQSWKDIAKANKEKYINQAWDRVLREIAYVAKKLEGKKAQLIAASIRSPEDILKIAQAEPQIITIPTKIVEGLQDIEKIKQTVRTIDSENVTIIKSISHPMTSSVLEEFEKAADLYRNK